MSKDGVNLMMRYSFWLLILIQMIDNSALASELNDTLWYRNNWLYLIGLLIILIFIIKTLYNINNDEIKGKKSFNRPLTSRERIAVFNIYYREPPPHSIRFLGKVIERRLKERGNNFEDLLAKVRRDYVYRVIDPNGIFLLGSNYERDKK